MRRLIICTTLLIMFSSLLLSIQQEIELPKGEIELQFENVKLSNLSFIDGKRVRVVIAEKAEVDVSTEKQILKLYSSNPVKVELELPKDRTYTFEKANLSCRFTNNMIIIHDKTEDTIIIFKDETLTIEKIDGTKIAEISPEGIFAYDDNQTVTIGREGIFIEGDGHDKQIIGFWGKMIGGFVRLVTGGVMSVVDSSPEKIITDVVNDEQGKMISSLFDSTADNSIKKNINKTFEGDDGVVTSLEIANSNGDVNISTWSESYVEVEIEMVTNKDKKNLDEVEISIEGKKDCIIKTLNRPRSVSVNFDIKIPKETVVKTVKTTNGRVILQDVKGQDLVVESSNGGIETANVYNIRSLNTSNARIRSEILNMTDDIDIQTSNGTVQLLVNPNLNAHFQMRTSNGSINTNVSNFVVKERTKFTLQGEMGDSINTIRVNTSNSNININEMK